MAQYLKKAIILHTFGVQDCQTFRPKLRPERLRNERIQLSVGRQKSGVHQGLKGLGFRVFRV